MNYKAQTRNQASLLSSGKFWALTFLLILIYTAFIFAQNTVYIDPTNSGDPGQNGSIDHPYDSWSDFPFVSGNTYLQKAGTTCNTTQTILISIKNDITLGSYGTGPKPIIHKASGNGDNIEVSRSRDIVIDGFELIGNDGNIGIGVGGNYSSPVVNENIQILNCDIHDCWGAVYGIRYNPAWTVASDSIYIYRCNIWDINEDGIYLDYSTNPRIVECHLWNINMEWFMGVTAPGDGIQLTWGCTNWLIKDCIIDRRTTAGKMAVLIASNDVNNPEYSGSFIGNTVYTPKDTLPRWPGDQVGGCGLYITDNHHVVIAYNKFIGRGYPVASNGTQQKGQGAVYVIQNGATDFYYNLFDSTAAGGLVSACNPLNFYNNAVISDQAGDYILLVGGIDNGYARNNISAGNTTNPALWFSTSPGLVQSNNLSTAAPASTWNSTLGIVDWETSDFHLTENSPARNTGFNYSGYFFDLDSIAVPQENLRDRGVCEYSDGSQTTNNPPVIANQAFSINENSPNGTLVGTVVATDPDAGQTLTYSIISGNSNNAFQINASTGALSVNNSAALNFEVITTFGLTVRAQDNGQGNLYSQATITVNLTNVNENPNISNQTFSIAENSPNGQQVGVVVATDPDAGQTLTYSIIKRQY